MVNKHWITCPLRVALADGHQVMSIHMCDIHIEGLLFVLTGHIILNSSIASLFGMQALTEVGCKVAFDKYKNIIQYYGKIILSGGKDPATDLWTLSLGLTGTTSHHNNAVIPSTAPVVADTHANLTTQIAFFAHTMQNKAYSIHLIHQFLCSSRISTLLKAIQHSYLKGCPNLTVKGVFKYLKPSPATAKGHMRCPCQGIRSTRQGSQATTVIGAPWPSININTINNYDSDNIIKLVSPHCTTHCHSNIIKDNDMSGAANLFCFAAFADKQTGTLYNDLTDTFPFMSLEGNACFLVVYHYKSNVIMALPIAGFGNKNHLCGIYTTI
jgi:hypothetical protein